MYKDFKWLETEGQPLYVPITWCVPMTPAFADMDRDGIAELFSGCYDGEIYTWKKGENGEYTDPKIIILADGTPLKIGNAATVFPGDPDGDGKVDLLVTSLYNGRIPCTEHRNSGGLPFRESGTGIGRSGQKENRGEPCSVVRLGR